MLSRRGSCTRERDIALAAAAHWRANAGEAERRKRHVSGLLSEKCRELETLRLTAKELVDAIVFPASADRDEARRAGWAYAPMARARDRVAALLREQP